MGGYFGAEDALPQRRDRPTFIYALIDPRADLVRYVGRTVHPDMRLAQHMSAHARPSVRAWVLDLRRRGLEPRMDILAIAGVDDDPGGLEQAFIRMHAVTILNVHLDGTRYAPRGPRVSKVLSVGATALRARIERPGASNALSRKIGAPYGLVSRWSRGKIRPAARWCAALEAECGIPASAWVVPASAEGEA